MYFSSYVIFWLYFIVDHGQDVLENEDVKLDNMFIASLVGDIVRVS